MHCTCHLMTVHYFVADEQQRWRESCSKHDREPIQVGYKRSCSAFDRNTHFQLAMTQMARRVILAKFWLQRETIVPSSSRRNRRNHRRRRRALWCSLHFWLRPAGNYRLFVLASFSCKRIRLIRTIYATSSRCSNANKKCTCATLCEKH